ncbi:hypothetical protein BU16DRAFT_529947 [Lophium mytilinum]|uniref:C4-dicarboxylate transporter/malic acid transport protein n=1 Tax=Lophium mytilinum TaxID=390894 RepID=A0A6A6QG96_9PEZI|nr:hypothetical protein BU16DRAFT_529947 [Lophium mytilinum]
MSLTTVVTNNTATQADIERRPSWQGHLGLRDRLQHFTWAWFTLTMSTGGLATLLHAQTHKFPGLNTIGTIVFIFDLLLFASLTSAITARFILFPRAFRKSLHNPAESLFYPCFWLSISTVILGIQAYGVPACGPWLPVVLRIIFWIYVACTFSVAVVQYYFLFTAANLTFHSMTPAWILPVFPVMLSGTIASLIAPDQPPEQRLPIIVAGVTFQGLGILVSMIMYPIYLGHLMTDGLPAIDLRPGMFISVGPPSFTTLALIGMANALPPNYGFFATHPIAIEVLQTMALFTGCFLWALGFWLWWAFVFPNVGFTIATIDIGRGFESEGILWLGSVMTVLIVVTWCFVFFSHVRAVLRHKILWPGRDEDKDA